MSQGLSGMQGNITFPSTLTL